VKSVSLASSRVSCEVRKRSSMMHMLSKTQFPGFSVGSLVWGSIVHAAGRSTDRLRHTYASRLVVVHLLFRAATDLVWVSGALRLESPNYVPFPICLTQQRVNGYLGCTYIVGIERMRRCSYDGASGSCISASLLILPRNRSNVALF
jgi:hypothetical protein